MTLAARSRRCARKRAIYLELSAGFDSRAAKAELLQKVEDEARRDAMVLVRDVGLRAREEADRRARRILATTVQRLAADVVSETTVSVGADPIG